MYIDIFKNLYVQKNTKEIDNEYSFIYLFYFYYIKSNTMPNIIITLRGYSLFFIM